MHSLTIFISSIAIQAKPKKNKKVEEPVTPKVELITDMDSASYAMGVYMGKQSAMQLSSQNFNLDLFVKAFVDAVTDAPLLLSPDSSVMFLNAYEKRVKEQEAAERIKKGEELCLDSKTNRNTNVSSIKDSIREELCKHL